MGKFLKSGLKTIGNSRFIGIYEGKNPFLTFKPRNELDSIYVIRSIAAKTDIHMALNTIYGVDYEIMHR
jgi:hypothetical protein